VKGKEKGKEMGKEGEGKGREGRGGMQREEKGFAGLMSNCFHTRLL